MTQLPSLQKGKKPIDTLPAPDVIGIVSSFRELVPSELSLSVPVLLYDIGHSQKRFDFVLLESQAKKLNAIYLGLASKDAKLANGVVVKDCTGAIRWMIENAQ